jgi:hypothetical protein
LNHGAVSSTVQLEIHTPKDAGCDARRDKGFHFEILAFPCPPIQQNGKCC